MSQDNVETFRRGLEARNRGDIEALLETLDAQALRPVSIGQTLQLPPFELRV